MDYLDGNAAKIVGEPNVIGQQRSRVTGRDRTSLMASIDDRPGGGKTRVVPRSHGRRGGTGGESGSGLHSHCNRGSYVKSGI